MRRLSATALEAVRRAVDDSPALRASMALAAPTEEDIGSRAAWLFVHRPSGWDVELATLEVAASERSSADDAATEERSARRRLRVAEDELAALRSALADTRATAARVVGLEAAVAEERRGRGVAEAALAELQARVVGLERERDAAHRRASAADKALAEARRTSAADAVTAGPAADRADLDGVRRSVTAAAAAVASAADALTAAGLAVDAAVSAPLPAGRRRDASTTSSTPSPVRLPSTLPPGILEDDPAAADHLVRLPSAVLLVDGYNLSLRRWPDLALTEQRARLVDSLNALVARVGVEVEVVFDGEDDSGRGIQSAGGRRRAVRITFSPDAVDADEVLLGRVEGLPRSRPVVVATDDRRVQREAAARGANVIGSSALFAVLGLRG
jgi:predicted RNA-binding protein with PIN domain